MAGEVGGIGGADVAIEQAIQPDTAQAPIRPLPLRALVAHVE